MVILRTERSSHQRRKKIQNILQIGNFCHKLLNSVYTVKKPSITKPLFTKHTQILSRLHGDNNGLIDSPVTIGSARPRLCRSDETVAARSGFL